MRTLIALLALVSTISTAPLSALAQAHVGGAAPDFQLKDANGKETTLSQFKGKIVVLEWFNPNCPFVKKFYSAGDMPRFQKKARDMGAVWLTINSSAEGKPGYLSQEDAPKTASSMGLEPAALLLDPKGTVGKMYGARTTPHMFVVNPAGTLVYAGAIDSTPSTDASDIEGATNYVLNAVDSVAKGKDFDPVATEPYGCSVKY
jgi:AhpC/TSA family